MSAEVSIRDLRNHGGEVVDRVAQGESLTVTRNGAPVAELRPLHGRGITLDVLRSRWRRLPALDPAALRHDVDSVLDQSL